MRDKPIFYVNALLAVVAALALALTFYSCFEFYTFLPTSDTWVYTDFLAQAAQGHLDTSTLLAKHNHVHVIALPKLIYFFDAWLMQGSGVLVTFVSLAAMLATTAIFVFVVTRINTINKAERIFLALVSIILLMSACQIESLVNPANLQWSLLVFSATLTAWFIYRAVDQKSASNIAGIITGIVLATLTSASSLLIIIPLGLLMLGKKIAIRIVMASSALALIVLVIAAIFYFDDLTLVLTLFKNWLKFTIDFLAPPVERLHSLPASMIAGAIVLWSLYVLAKTPFDTARKETIFFGFLLWFSLFVIFATGIARSYSAVAFTFRFVNLGLLFAAALFPLMFLYLKRGVVMLAITIYVGLLACVNVKEVSVFGFGSNHIRLTQVAHALDINDSFVIAGMPGTVWEKDDFNYVQANKHKLREAHTGIYASREYQHLGKSMNELKNITRVSCKTDIIKMRRLLPDQASWRLIGQSKTETGKNLSHAWFVDGNNVIRGFAIPLQPERNVLQNIVADKQWGGFFNLEAIALNATTLAANPAETTLTLYAYSDDESEICQGEIITLPEYKDLRKKSARSE